MWLPCLIPAFRSHSSQPSQREVQELQSISQGEGLPRRMANVSKRKEDKKKAPPQPRRQTRGTSVIARVSKHTQTSELQTILKQEVCDKLRKHAGTTAGGCTPLREDENEHFGGVGGGGQCGIRGAGLAHAPNTQDSSQCQGAPALCSSPQARGPVPWSCSGFLVSTWSLSTPPHSLSPTPNLPRKPGQRTL